MAATESAPPVVVCDAGPLIHLDELNCLDLLADFERVLVPEAVWKEVDIHRPSALTHPGVNLVRVPPQPGAQPAALGALARVLILHTGELEALQVALEHGRCMMLTDDSAARLAARNQGIAAHGTVGVLVRSIRRELRTAQQILEVLQSLPQKSTLHLKRSLLEAVMREVESLV